MVVVMAVVVVMVVTAVRGHPFMTSTRRGRGQAQVVACVRGGAEVRADVHTENVEIYDLRVKILNFRVND